MSVSAAVFYGVCSGSMAFINKIVMTTYNFQHADFIMLCQMLFTASLLESLRRCGTINIPAYSLELGKTLFLPSIFYALHSVSALTALGSMNIPMYNVIKRCVPVVNLFIAPCILKKGAPSIAIVSSVSLMTFGCVIAGMGDVQFSMSAYIYGGISIFSQALYLLFIQKTGMEKEISAVGILFVNSINCIPLLAIYNLGTLEFFEALSFPDILNPLFLVAFLLVIVMGCVLNYSMFLCTTMNSALTTSLVGVIKALATTAIGMFTFGGVEPTFMIIAGISMNTIGGIWYSWIKHKEKIAKTNLKPVINA